MGRPEPTVAFAEELVDPLFGAICWHLGPEGLVLAGDAVPGVELIRLVAGEPTQGVPIGTRRRRDLRMTVGGHSVDLRPGKGGLPRRSYRIAVRTRAADLLFTPSSPTQARLVRGSTYRGDNELGTFERFEDGSVFATWSVPVTVLGKEVQAPVPEPAEAAVGYALAAGFGTGALFFLAACTNALEQVLPF